MKKSLSKFPQPDWEGMRTLQSSLSEERSLQQRVQDWLELQDLFHKQLQDTENIFRSEREAHLKELQERLQKVGAQI